jgi:hypothetical protein
MNTTNTRERQVEPRPPADSAAALPQALYGLVELAVEESATDIHIDAWGCQAVLRFRVDGTIQEKEPLTYDQARKLINQIKARVSTGHSWTVPSRRGLVIRFRSPNASQARNPKGLTNMRAPCTEVTTHGSSIACINRTLARSG